MASYFIGVDVGTGSARAGVFDLNGRMVGQASRAIDLYRPKADFVEQSSDNIWQAVCNAVRDAVNQADINPIQVKGLGFDATCSLVVLDKEGKPLTVSPSGRTEQNIIVWMDHRAIAQAERINATKHRVLDFVGGIISPEMQTPKLLWLKQHMPTTWANAGYLFDLPDFLTWRATQDATRSLCSTVCKWTYLGHEQRWDKSYFQQIGLEDVLEHDAAKIGSDVKMMGEPLGHGLTQRAAGEMGLIAGTAVSVSIIDAHAGTLGTLGATGVSGVSGEVADFNRRVALIGGTSTGHMAMSRTARFIGGVWGPYYSAILPEYWLNEGGQSATGALIDHVIQSHPCYPELLTQAKTQGQTIYEVLNAILRRMAGEPENIAFLTQDIHMLPYFHGNRSPRANPTLTGILTGLKLSRTPEDMALHYLATIQAIALGTRHIIETMNHSGYSIDTIMASGGGTKNPIFVQEHANATGCAMLLPEESEAMLLGGAMMGTVAAGVFDTLPEAMSAMSRIGKTVTPQTNQIKSYYDRKYRVFHELYNDHMKYRRLMQEEA
ncbi:FGGY-family carbohydrate kinase [Serratia sarumanii]|uniref:FGGY-family carbohydrate kinase n=1 Tax=Serratia sarumanii TaxID=3020826 RepID=UPI003F80175A